MTHGSPELDADAAKLLALGADPGPTLEDFPPEGAFELMTEVARQPSLDELMARLGPGATDEELRQLIAVLRDDRASWGEGRK